MDFEISWTEPARAALVAAVRHVADSDPEGAEQLGRDLLASVDILARFPFIGPVHERRRAGEIREILCRRYRIFYQPYEDDRRVEVLLVWHASRREPRLPRR